MRLTLELLEETYSVCKLDAGVRPTMPCRGSGLWNVCLTDDELSLVTRVGTEPPDALEIETPWRCLRVQGPLDFGLVGILADITQALAEAGVSLFALSTYDTDYVLVKNESLEAAIAALQGWGHVVRRRIHEP